MELTADFDHRRKIEEGWFEHVHPELGNFTF